MIVNLFSRPDGPCGHAHGRNVRSGEVEFVSVKEGYSQLQKYTLNLDYGIVTEAKCYENDALIYDMYTDSISDNSTPGFAIPKEFMSYLPSGFMPDTDE